MRNHEEKSCDMARSVLPSAARKATRDRRALAHGRERARLRRELHAVSGYADPDDFDGDLTWTARPDLEHMVRSRRAADKVGPLLTWAARLVERDPVLAAATPEDREVHFRTILPPGLIGNHAISHLVWVLDPDRPWSWPWLWDRRPGADAWTPDVELVEAIIAAGCHGELNRRLRADLGRLVTEPVRRPRSRVVDGDRPVSGELPSRRVTDRSRRPIRFLAGAHDAQAFVDDADPDVLEVMRAFHAEVSG